MILFYELCKQMVIFGVVRDMILSDIYKSHCWNVKWYITNLFTPNI